jgi:hypothetical protein
VRVIFWALVVGHFPRGRDLNCTFVTIRGGPSFVPDLFFTKLANFSQCPLRIFHTVINSQS